MIHERTGPDNDGLGEKSFGLKQNRTIRRIATYYRMKETIKAAKSDLGMNLAIIALKVA